MVSAIEGLSSHFFLGFWDLLSVLAASRAICDGRSCCSGPAIPVETPGLSPRDWISRLLIQDSDLQSELASNLKRAQNLHAFFIKVVLEPETFFRSSEGGRKGFQHRSVDWMADLYASFLLMLTLCGGLLAAGAHCAATSAHGRRL